MERATLTSLRNGVPYSFRVRAHNALGFGPWTSVLRAAPAIPTLADPESSAPAPAASPTPVVLQPEAAAVQSEAVVVQPLATPSVTAYAASPVVPVPPGMVGEVSALPSNASVALSWAAPMAGGVVSGYEVRVRIAGSTSWDTPLQDSSTSAEVSGLLNGQEYEFSVRATGAAVGDWSPSVRSTAGSPTAPGAPKTRFTSRALDVATGWSSDGVELSGGQLIGWQMRYRAAGDSAWTTRDVNDADVRQAALGTLPRGFQYEFAVRAVSEFGAGAWSTPSLTYVPQFSMPVMKIDTAASTPITSTEYYLQADYSLDTDDATAPGSSTFAAMSGKTEIKGRGNSTWFAPKKPYRLKLAADASLLGMNTSRHWVLLANAYDHSLLRNDTALYIGSRTGLAWTPSTRYVEVLLNGDYIGLYQLAEQVRIDPKRIAIDPMKKKDISGDAVTGGYQLERDGRWDSGTEPGFLSSMGQPIAIKDPEALAKEQSAYIEQYFDAFEAALQSDDRGDPDIGYAKYIDVDSFVDWYLVEEYTQNVDANLASQDLYKPRRGRLTMGPLWDFDLALGNDPHLDGKRQSWWVKEGAWWQQFFEDPAWEARVEARWHVLRQSLGDVRRHLEVTRTSIAAAAESDSRRWDDYGDHEAQVEVVEGFLTERAAWLDTQWGVA